MKARRPGARIIGVEAEASPGAVRSLEAGAPTHVEMSDTLADGIAVKQVGALTYPHLEALVEANGQRAAIEAEADVIRTMSRVEPLRIVSGATEGDSGARGVTLVVSPLVVRLPLEGVVDLDAEGERLRAELADCDKNLERVEKLVSNPNFREKARPDVVENEEARLAELRERKQRLDEILQQLGR